MDENKLRKYAELLVCAGGNVKKGDYVMIVSSVDDAYFARLVQEYAYDAGASLVVMDWYDNAVTRTQYLRAADKTFTEFPAWMAERDKYYDEKGMVYLFINSPDPELLSNVEPGRIQNYLKLSNEARALHNKKLMSSELRRSILAIPSKAWAKKVFPDLPIEAAMEALWSLVLECSRADGTDPINDWNNHKSNFRKRLEYLNNQNFKSLRLKTNLGTDIIVELVENHIWVGCNGVDPNGICFLPNIPTEEIFTTPNCKGVNGKIVASRPLPYQGNLIEGIELIFKDGRLSEWKTQNNFQLFESILNVDEGSFYLGEIALVDKSSPITKTKRIFYNLLYDENSSCHMALGNAYIPTIKNGNKMDLEQLKSAGVNNSLQHIDFMFGTEDLSIVGNTFDGKEILFFDNGEFII